MACSTLTGSSSAVQPQRRTSRPKWVSTVMPGTSKALPRMTLAVLRPMPGQLDQLVEGVRQHAVVLLDDGRAQPDQRGGLVPEEPGGPDHLLELGAVGLGVVGRGGIAGEQRRGDLVDPLVGALRGQDRGHGEFQRRGEVQLAVRVGIGGGERRAASARPGARGPRAGSPAATAWRAGPRCAGDAAGWSPRRSATRGAEAHDDERTARKADRSARRGRDHETVSTRPDAGTPA